MSYHTKRSRLTGRKAPSEDVQLFRTLPSFRLHMLAQYSSVLQEQQYKERFGLNLVECRILSSISSRGMATHRQIRDDVNLSRSKADIRIGRLARRGLLVKVVDVRDRRIMRLALTESGRALHEALHSVAVSLNEDWLASISGQQREAFLTCLDILTKSARTLRTSKPYERT